MLSQGLPDVANGIDQRVRNTFAPKMVAHFVHNALPKQIAASLVNRFVTDNGKFVRARCNPNKNRGPMIGRVHAEPVKTFGCSFSGGLLVNFPRWM